MKDKATGKTRRRRQRQKARHRQERRPPVRGVWQRLESALELNPLAAASLDAAGGWSVRPGKVARAARLEIATLSGTPEHDAAVRGIASGAAKAAAQGGLNQAREYLRAYYALAARVRTARENRALEA